MMIVTQIRNVSPAPGRQFGTSKNAEETVHHQ